MLLFHRGDTQCQVSYTFVYGNLKLYLSALEKIISELSGALVEKGQSALAAQRKAVEAIAKHNQQLKKAMDDADVRSC